MGFRVLGLGFEVNLIPWGMGLLCRFEKPGL